MSNVQIRPQMYPAPRTPSLPANMLFSDGNAGPPYVYRESLAAPGVNGYDKCRAKPTGRIQRGIQ